MSDNKHSRFFDDFVDVVYELDAEGRIRYVNRAFLNLLRGSRGEIVGRKFSGLCLAHRKIQVEALVADCVGGEGAGRRFDVQLVRPDGSIVHLDCSLSPIDTDHGRVLRGMARELTESKKLQRELLSARDHAVSAMRLKGEFVANMSHEMRTPMNGIIGMTDLALETEVTDEQREYLLAVKSSANAMLTLINDILDFSKLEAGRLTLEEIEFSLADSVAESLTPLAVRAHQKGLELVYEFDPDIAESVVGDPSRLRQIIINLVDNAIKFTDRGQVHLAVSLEERAGQEATVRFDVTDTGIGIDESQHRVIFRSFCQADGTSTRRYGGTGLGLTISTQLVEMMGGDISVKSKPGAGSTFSFTAKFLFSDQPTTKHRLLNSQELRDVRVLVADDNSINRRTISTTLGSLGMDVVACSDGAEAWAAFHDAAEDSTPFAVALLDVQMPGIDGFTLAERILGDPVLSRTPLILLTLAGQRGDAAHCRELGVTGYLTKPFGAFDLAESIQAALGTTGQDAARLITRHSLRESRRKLKILVAEDNPINQRVARTLLRKQGHAVTVVENGRQAIEETGGCEFDAVIMDVQMPVLDGIEATAEIRAREAGSDRRTPILALTAHAREGDRQRFLDAGMDGYVSKPFHLPDLLAELDRLVGESGGTEQVAHHPGIAGVVREFSSQLIDRKRLLLQSGGDRDLLEEVVRMYLADRAVIVRELEMAVGNRDLRAIEVHAHKLKGTFGALAAGRAAATAQRLEEAGRDGRMEQAAGIAEELIVLVGSVEQELCSLLGDVDR